LEEELVKTRKEMEKFKALYLQNIPSIKASEVLTTILNQQRNPNLKTGLGYEEGSSCSHPSNKDPIKFVKSTFIDNNKYGETEEDNYPPRKSERKSTRTKTIEQINHQRGRNRSAQRRLPFSRYIGFFYGYCFFYSKFGHKAINCSLRFRYEKSKHSRNRYLPRQIMRQLSNKQSQTPNHVMAGKRTHVKHKNRYDPLFNEPGCYTCHNFGHKDADCRLRNYKPDLNPSAENVNVWKMKKNDKCGIVLSTQRQKNPWYIYSGCSKHMMGDKGKFLSLSESKSGNVTFGNDAPGKIRVKRW
jgi:hypothetical protein